MNTTHRSHHITFITQTIPYGASKGRCNLIAFARLTAPGKPRASVSLTSEAFQENDNLKSTWEHRAWLALGSGAITTVLAKSLFQTNSSNWEEVAVEAGALWAGYCIADLATGIYHWSIDNYGDASTPVFGPQIDAFQGHHKFPWTITQREVANNLHSLARPSFFFMLLVFFVFDSFPFLEGFLGSATLFVLMSQQLHAWAHSRAKDLPPLVGFLQDMGLIVPRKSHAAHHRRPYDGNYCIVSGAWNPLLDRSGFFRRIEMFIYETWGVKPRCWDEEDGSMEWIQHGSYFGDVDEEESGLSSMEME